MNTKHPNLADVVRKHRLINVWPTEYDRIARTKLTRECLCGWTSPEPKCTLTDHPEHVEQMWREARTITSTEQLQALPDRSVVRTALGSIAQRYGDTAAFIGAYPDDYHWENLSLPALLIHHPDWDTEPHTERP